MNLRIASSPPQRHLLCDHFNKGGFDAPDSRVWRMCLIVNNDGFSISIHIFKDKHYCADLQIFSHFHPTAPMQANARHQSRSSRAGKEKTFPTNACSHELPCFPYPRFRLRRFIPIKISVLTSKASPMNLHLSQLPVSSALEAW